MEEYGDIYYIDDPRNATRDHRTQGGIVRAGSRPSRTLVMQPQGRTGFMPAGAVYTQQAPVVYTQQQPVMYGEPSPTAGALLGRLTIAQLIELGAQAFAALQSLPPAPNPALDVETNTANMIVYQRALAEHAKNDEKIRTLGSLIAKLAG